MEKTRGVMVVSQSFEEGHVGRFGKGPRKCPHSSACAVKLSTNKCVRSPRTFQKFLQQL